MEEQKHTNMTSSRIPNPGSGSTRTEKLDLYDVDFDSESSEGMENIAIENQVEVNPVQVHHLVNFSQTPEVMSKLSDLELKIVNKILADKLKFQNESKHLKANVKSINPVRTLEKCKGFEITEPLVGSILKLRMVKQYPEQQDEGKPLFELADRSKQYEKMEKDMIKVYSSFTTEPRLDLSKVCAGTYAVLQLRRDEEEEAENTPISYEDESPVYKRIKFLSGPLHQKTLVFKVKFIDYQTQKLIDSNSDVLLLDKSFSTLPPRVSTIEMDNLSDYYKDGRLRKFIEYDSEEYLFDGLLTGEVQNTKKVLIWSDKFSKERFPYGINGYMLESIWKAIERTPKMPPQGYHMDGCFIVNADQAGYIYMHFNNTMSNHFLTLFSLFSNASIKPHSGLVTSIDEQQIYLAPHAKSDGSFYRAKIQSKWDKNVKLAKSKDKVTVRFIDYGDHAEVNVRDLVRANDVHYLLNQFPEICVKAHLANIQSLDFEKYINSFHRNDMECTVHVVTDATKDEVAQVILKYEDDQRNMQILNDVIIKEKLGRPVTVEWSGEQFTDHGLYVMNLACKPSYYVVRENGKSLQTGSVLDVFINYDKAMPANYYFIMPVNQTEKWHRFNQWLQTLLEKIRKSIKNEKNVGWNIQESGLHCGLGVLCFSQRINVLARGVLLRKSEKPVKKIDEVEKEGVADTIWDETWIVYLVDYGIVEQYKACQLIYSNPYCLSTPAFGCLAYHQGVGSPDTMKTWWESLKEHSGKTDYDEGFGFLQQVQRRVKIVSIVESKRFWEVAEVEWLYVGGN